MTWANVAWRAINEAHATLPADTSFADRKKAVDAAYPFGERAMWPYKAWLSARKAYLARYSDKPAGPLAPLPLSPLERAKARADEIAARVEQRAEKGAGR